MTKRRILFLVIIFLFVCSTPPVQADEAITSILARATYFSPNFETVLENYEREEVLLAFPLICGHYLGKPTAEDLFSHRFKKDRSFKLDINNKLADFDRLSCDLQERGIQQGLQMTPSTVRFARLATFARDPQSGKSFGGATFIDAETKELLFLIYFDRPSHWKGTIRESGYVVKVDIKIDARGAYWIRIVKKGDDRHLELRPAGNVKSVLLAVMPVDASK